MIEVWFLLGAALIAAIPSFVWTVVLWELLGFPWFAGIGAGLIFPTVMYYMISGRKLIKEQHGRG